MTRQTTDTDWITEGAKIAILSTIHGQTSVKVDTVERLTAKQIVLANGDRFRRDTLRKVGDSDPWRVQSTSLHRLDDPDVVNARAVIRVRNLIGRVGPVANGAGGYDSALVALDAIAEMVAETRKSIAGLKPDAARVAEGNQHNGRS